MTASTVWEFGERDVRERCLSVEEGNEKDSRRGF